MGFPRNRSISPIHRRSRVLAASLMAVGMLLFGMLLGAGIGAAEGPEASVDASAANPVTPSAPIPPPLPSASAAASNLAAGRPISPDAPVVDASIVMLGDSITYGGKWVELLGREDVSNLGIVGDSTQGFIKRMPQVYQRHPRIVFIMGGVNDLAAGAPAEGVFTNLRLIVQSLKLRHIIPVMQSTLYTRIPRYNRRIVRLNKLLERYAEKFKIEYIDLNVALSSKGLLLRKHTFDGIHLRPAAYEEWRRAVAQTLDKYRIKPMPVVTRPTAPIMQPTIVQSATAQPIAVQPIAVQPIVAQPAVAPSVAAQRATTQPAGRLPNADSTGRAPVSVPAALPPVTGVGTEPIREPVVIPSGEGPAAAPQSAPPAVPVARPAGGDANRGTSGSPVAGG